MFSKLNLNDLPIEGTSHSSGSRKMIVSKDQTTSKYFEAMTYGYLPAGVKWEMHDHSNIVEICIVTKGRGLLEILMEMLKHIKLVTDLFFHLEQNMKLKIILIRNLNFISLDFKINNVFYG